MKRVILGILFAGCLCLPGLLRADEPPTDFEKRESLVTYICKDEEGKEARFDAATYKNVPETLRQMQWNCYMDWDEMYKCQCRNPPIPNP